MGRSEKGRSEENDRVRSLADIQRAKIDLIEVGEGEVWFSLTELSLALGIPGDSLESLLSGKRGLVVLADEERGSLLRIENFYPGRDLWNEVLGSLREGRSDARKRRDLYHELRLACKLVKEADGAVLADYPVTVDTPPLLADLADFAKSGGGVDTSGFDLGDLMILANITFAALPEGIRLEIDQRGESPQFI